MIAAMMLMSVGAFAQDGKFAVGVDFNYLIDSDASRMAPGVKLQYEFIEDFRVEANFKYYLKKAEYILLLHLVFWALALSMVKALLLSSLEVVLVQNTSLPRTSKCISTPFTSMVRRTASRWLTILSSHSVSPTHSKQHI